MASVKISQIASLTLALTVSFVSCQEDTIDPVFFGSLAGKVTIESSGLPAVAVEITTSPPTSVIYTDSLGNFSFPQIAAGQYSVIAKLEGYTTSSKTISITKSTTTQADIALKRDLDDPGTPIVQFPASGQDSLPRTVTLIWSISNQFEDALTYSVIVYEGNQSTPLLSVTDQADTTLTLLNLKFNTTYFWQVKAKNEEGTETFGELWNFKTLPFPDNRFLFTTRRDGNLEVYSSDQSSTSEVRLTFSPDPQGFPRYSSDRKMIALASFTGLEFHLFTMKNNGEELQQITSLPATGYHNPGKGFCWAPDNGKIMYSHYDQLFIINRDGSNRILAAVAPPNRHFRGCDWTTIGNSVVVETVGVNPYDVEIRLLDLVTSQDSIIIDNLPGTLQSPSFSIDGKKILYTYDVSGFESSNGRQLDSRIFIYNLETGTTTDLSDEKSNGTNDLNPRFSPTGAQIIFENSANDGSGTPSIWILNIADGSREMVFNNASMPDWR